MSFLDTRHKKKSFTLTTLLLSALLLLLFYIGLTYLDPPIENGIAVNFGTMDYGSGEVQPTERVRSEPREVQNQPEPEEQAEPAQSEETVVEDAPVEEVLTSNDEETIKLRQQEEAKRKAEEEAEKAKAEAERIAREKREAEERKRQEQEAKKKSVDALIGGIGKSEGTTTGSEGDDDKAGDKGQLDGDPYATSYYGAPGSGGGTGGYGLRGRSLAGKDVVRQECNEEGRVVVRIVVDRNGKVIQAQPGVKGTTNNAPCLLEPARKTALLHRWNSDANAPTQQIGFVVVNFKLGQ
ncbi:energy transducer TonB [Flagellimonas halotolerans]|uniref:Energy transducer TonB n=1 Tax=Flagellimonas halotolerans TaxID=3112164 RepID=A0ABU6IVI7_9FLAO|nr:MULTISPECIES: energy transducer TonB [unclassified Allomuricauda]MEC3967080.1 energy transducer TonB [Muricauda sp. SYSU M86414]MEC4266943.1 energy transducer TonB [Muricauda sp. SYSU M84420]